MKVGRVAPSTADAIHSVLLLSLLTNEITDCLKNDRNGYGSRINVTNCGGTQRFRPPKFRAHGDGGCGAGPSRGRNSAGGLCQRLCRKFTSLIGRGFKSINHSLLTQPGCASSFDGRERGFQKSGI